MDYPTKMTDICVNRFDRENERKKKLVQSRATDSKGAGVKGEKSESRRAQMTEQANRGSEKGGGGGSAGRGNQSG